MKIATTSRFLGAVLILTATTGAAAFLRSTPPPLGAAQVLARLPRGSSIHSLLRADLDGHSPAEVAAVARIPALPGARAIVHVAVIFRYDRLRRTFVEAYRAPTPGSVPFSVDAVPRPGGREAVVFSGLRDDGTRVMDVVGLQWGRLRRLGGRDADAVRALPEPLPSVTWRYVVRNGAIVARTSTVRLHPRQTLRVQPAGGGPSSIILPDQRLDVVESGYRARRPGTYRIRVITGLPSEGDGYTLTVEVEP